jgi:hypothetical protein
MFHVSAIASGKKVEMRKPLFSKPLSHSPEIWNEQNKRVFCHRLRPGIADALTHVAVCKKSIFMFALSRSLDPFASNRAAAFALV